MKLEKEFTEETSCFLLSYDVLLLMIDYSTLWMFSDHYALFV